MSATLESIADALEFGDNEPVPCDGCPLRESCGKRALDCVAFRRYANMQPWDNGQRGRELKPL